VTPGRFTAAGAARLAARFPKACENGFYRSAQGALHSSLGMGTYLGHADDDTDAAYVQSVRAAVLGGVNVIDTAINYRHTRSERAIGAALASLFGQGVSRDELLVCTKAGFLTPGAIPPGLLSQDDIAGGCHCLHPAFLADQIERSLSHLGLGTIDVFYVHNPETQLESVSRAVFEDRLRAAFERLEQLAAENKIACYGAATWNGFRLPPGHARSLSLRRIVEIARQASGEDHHFRYVQLPVNLAMPEAFTRPHEDGSPASLLEVAARLGVTVVASAPLLQARLASGLPDELRSRWPETRTEAQFAIQFARSTPGVTTVLIGMSRPEHVAENLALRDVPPAAVEEYLALFHREA
jgi:aryl-alcohol dehydrogenase-like predicted oxidoreductase